MKKLFTFMAIALLSTATAFAGNFGIMINGTDYHAGEVNPNPGDPTFQEFMALGVNVTAGSTIQLYDYDNNAGWAVDLDPASTQAITRDGDHYVCAEDGCYDFYIKIKENADQLYVGVCKGQGGGEGQETKSFGIMINGTDYHAGELNPNPLDPSFTEYQVLGVSVVASATLQLYDEANKAGWAVDLDPASTTAITRDGDHYLCTEDGCYDFYIKIKENADQLYVGVCKGQGGEGGENPGGQGGPLGEKDYYLKGYRGPTKGDIGVPSQEEYFECGKLTYEFEGKDGVGYFFVIVCEPGQLVGECYMAKAFSTEQHTSLWPESQLKKEGINVEKLAVPAPSATFYLYDNGDGSLELSTVELPNKTLVGGCNEQGGNGGENQAIDQTEVVVKARKVVIDGQLRIVRGDKIFDVTGRQLN